MKINEEWKQKNGLYKCPICGELKTKNGICSHILCKHDKNRRKNLLLHLDKNHTNRIGQTSYTKNKVLVYKDINMTKYIDKSLLNDYLNNGWFKGNIKNLNNIPKNKGTKLSEEQKKLISIKMKDVARNRVHSWSIGRGKSGWYKGYWCDSSWELAYVIYCLDHNINIIRNKDCFSYVYENEIHSYYPDFYKPDEKLYIEIKGFENKRDKEKIKQFTGNIKVYYYQDMKDIMNYVKNIYGNDFIRLYENRKQDIIDNKINEILNCGVDFHKDGWRKELQKLYPDKCMSKFMKRYMKDFYDSCFKQENHIVKTNTSMYGTYWITNGYNSVPWKDNKGEIPNGYYRGRVIKARIAQSG